jgi:hypothetical protein
MNPRQGRDGQHRFAQLCSNLNSSLDVVLNSPQEDMHGWDHIVEISPPENSNLPADLRVAKLTIFSQIKTTKDPRPKTKIKLSNALKAVNSASPFFVFLFHYTQNGSPALYGRHVWKDEIEYFLKRARQAKNGNVNSKTVTIVFDERDQIKINPAEWIMAVLSTSSDLVYAADKKIIVDSAGYTEFSMIGNFKIVASDVDELVLHEIGLIEDIPFVDFEMYDQRFGIKSSEPVQSHASGRIKMTREGQKCAISLQSINGEEFTLPAKAWLPIIARPGEKEFRSRIEAGHLQLILASDPKNEKFSIRQDTIKKYPFIEQLGYLTFEKWQSEGDVRATLFNESGILSEIFFNQKETSEKWKSQMWHCARFAYDVLGVQQASEIELSIQDIFNSLKDQAYISSLMTAGSMRLESSFESPLQSFDKLVGYSYGRLCDWSYGAVVEIDHPCRTIEGEAHTLYFSRPSIVKRFAFKQPLEMVRKRVRDEYEEFRKGHRSVTATLGDGDLSKWSKDFIKDDTLIIDVDD